MDRTERFYKIDQMLQGGVSVSFVKLQEALGISRAQLKRVREQLRAARDPEAARAEAPHCERAEVFAGDLQGHALSYPLAMPSCAAATSLPSPQRAPTPASPVPRLSSRRAKPFPIATASQSVC